MRKRKKYNPLKQAQTLAKHSLRNTAIGCIPGHTDCQLLDLSSQSLMPITNSTVKLITGLRHPWSVFIAAFGVDHNGDHYMKSKEIFVQDPQFQSEMVETLNTHHVQLCKEFNASHLISVGWLATPYKKDWQEEEAFNLLDKLGALQFSSSNDNEVVETQ